MNQAIQPRRQETKASESHETLASRAKLRPRRRATCNQRNFPPCKTSQQDACRNQQYSIAALTDSAGAAIERYAYSAYGESVFLNASGTVIAGSAEDNRYTYTGREWDTHQALYHFRARMYQPEAGRFLGRDPVGLMRKEFASYQYVGNHPPSSLDPLGYFDIVGAICGSTTTWASCVTCCMVLGPNQGVTGNCWASCAQRFHNDRDPPPTTLLNYGHYCGPTRAVSADECDCGTFSGQGPFSEDPIDAMDAACREHDCCVGTALLYLNLPHHLNCNRIFCRRLLTHDCSESPIPRECESYRLRAIALTCATIDGGISPLPIPVPFP